jgi:DNA-binding MarR family transcriptional regulator
MKPRTAPKALADRLARDCLGVRIRMIHRAVSALYDAALRPHGLRVGQMTLLVGVAYAGPIKPTRLGRVLHLEKSTLSRDVELLRRKGWIAVETDPEGRGQVLGLTAAGAAVLEAVLPAWEEAQAQAEELLGEAGVGVVHAVAAKLGFPVCGR